MAGLLCAGCDLGGQNDEPAFPTGAPIHLVDANVGTNRPIAPGEDVELYFDRLLLPGTVTRQSFAITDLQGNAVGNPNVLYDPVARVVTLHLGSGLAACQTYRVYLVTPGDAADPYGLRAIDGATLDPSTPQFIEFPVVGTCATGGDAAAPVMDAGPGFPAPPADDFCQDVLPPLFSHCTGTCHGASFPAMGLSLVSGQSIADTAINRASVEGNTGSRAMAGPESTLFGLDMPIIDRGSATQGNPGDSWLMYKLLLAVPTACSTTPGAAACDAGAPTLVHNPHTRPWKPLSDAERATLGRFIPGREMPFPIDPSAPPQGTASSPITTLTLDELEALSFWIQQGAPLPSCSQ